MKKVLATGGSGLLGSEFVNTKSAEFEILLPTHQAMDISDSDSVFRYIAQTKPDWIINCAGIISIDKCELDRTLCFGVNRDGVENIMKAIVAVGKPVGFIQVSSSEVFGRVNEGEYKIEGYAEREQPAPVSNYQKSKAEAESIVSRYGLLFPLLFPNWFVARAGWLYGRGRKTFVENFYADLQESKELEIIEDQWRSPTWTKHFCEGVWRLIERGAENGIYHIANEVAEGEATTMQVIEAVSSYLGENRIKAKVKTIPRAGFFKVPRAPSNVIKNTKLPPLPEWRSALKDYLSAYFPR